MIIVSFGKGMGKRNILNTVNENINCFNVNLNISYFTAYTQVRKNIWHIIQIFKLLDHMIEFLESLRLKII